MKFLPRLTQRSGCQLKPAGTFLFLIRDLSEVTDARAGPDSAATTAKRCFGDSAFLLNLYFP